MRELSMTELTSVSGGTQQCSNNYGGITDTQSLGREIIQIYEGLIEATSYIIERVANALD
jgi:hypothetical protein